MCQVIWRSRRSSATLVVVTVGVTPIINREAFPDPGSPCLTHPAQDRLMITQNLDQYASDGHAHGRAGR